MDDIGFYEYLFIYMLLAGVVSGLFFPIKDKLFKLTSIKNIAIVLLYGIALIGLAVFVGNDRFGVELKSFNIHIYPLFFYFGMFFTGFPIGVFFKSLIKDIVSLIK